MEDTSILTMFQDEQVDKTLSRGRIYFGIGIVAILFFAVMDVRQGLNMVIPILRVVSTIPAFIFIFLSIKYLPKNRYLVIPFYNICLTTVLVKITAVTLMVRGNEEIAEELTTTIMLGTASVVFISSLAALGARLMYAKWMIRVIILFSAFYLILGLPFIRQLLLIDLIAIFSIVTIRGQYKHEYERFKAVKQVEAKERELKIAIEKLATANADLKSFNRSISHDLKTPVRNAISFTQLLLREIKNPSSKAEDYGDFILNSLQKMNNLINSLFEFSKIGHRSLQKTTVDLSRLAREAYEEQLILRNRDERHITFILEDLPCLVADPVLIGGVMNNLISNAIKYSSKKPHSIVEVGAYRNGSDYTIFVKDNGAGFDQKQYKKKVFQIFKRLHSDSEFEGSGIGLSIVERIIQKHGGRVWAESEIGKGATFYFTLPVQQAMAA